MTERSGGSSSPDPRTGSRAPSLEDRLDILLADIRDHSGNERSVSQLEDIVSEAIAAKDVRALVFIHAHAQPTSDRTRTVNEGLYLLHHATEIALRGLMDRPSPDEYAQIARLSFGLPIALEPGGGGFASLKIRPTIFGLEEAGVIRMDDDFGYELTGLGAAHAELWARDFPKIIEALQAEHEAHREKVAKLGAFATSRTLLEQ